MENPNSEISLNRKKSRNNDTLIINNNLNKAVEKPIDKKIRQNKGSKNKNTNILTNSGKIAENILKNKEIKCKVYKFTSSSILFSSKNFNKILDSFFAKKSFCKKFGTKIIVGIFKLKRPMSLKELKLNVIDYDSISFEREIIPYNTARKHITRYNKNIWGVDEIYNDVVDISTNNFETDSNKDINKKKNIQNLNDEISVLGKTFIKNHFDPKNIKKDLKSKKKSEKLKLTSKSTKIFKSKLNINEALKLKSSSKSQLFHSQSKAKCSMFIYELKVSYSEASTFIKLYFLKKINSSKKKKNKRMYIEIKYLNEKDSEIKIIRKDEFKEIKKSNNNFKKIGKKIQYENKNQLEDVVNYVIKSINDYDVNYILGKLLLRDLYQCIVLRVAGKSCCDGIIGLK